MLKKAFSWAKSLDKRIKFIFVGGLNTLIGYGVNALVLLLVFRIPLGEKATGTQAFIGAACGHIAGMTNAYFWNKYFTFEVRERSLLEVAKFLIISLAQLGLNQVLVMFFQHPLDFGIYLSQAVALVFTTIFSYLGHNYITFSKKERQ